MIRSGRHPSKGGYDVGYGHEYRIATPPAFTAEYKAGVVRLVLDQGKSIRGVFRELDLSPTAVGEWVKQARAERTGGRTGLTAAERTELAARAAGAQPTVESKDP